MDERETVSGMSVFVAVVEAGSLAEAARRTGLTPSAVSKLVQRLEARLGARLLSRSTRRMTVTDAGQTFYTRAQAILGELRAVAEEMAEKTAAPRGVVRISAPLLLGQTRVVPILLEFQRRVPSVSLDVDLSDRPVDLVGERIDVAVRVTFAPPASFVAQHVGDLHRVLCAAPAYLAGRKPPRRPRDLAEHACLAFSGPQAQPVWQLRGKGGAEDTVRIDGPLRVSSVLSLHDAAKAGLGIAELPRYLVEDDLRAGRLRPVLPGFHPRAPGVYVVYAPARFQPARVRELSRHLVPALKQALR